MKTSSKTWSYVLSNIDAKINVFVPLDFGKHVHNETKTGPKRKSTCVDGGRSWASTKPEKEEDDTPEDRQTQ